MKIKLVTRKDHAKQKPVKVVNSVNQNNADKCSKAWKQHWMICKRIDILFKDSYTL